jgi:hypothetical protein
LRASLTHPQIPFVNIARGSRVSFALYFYGPQRLFHEKVIIIYLHNWQVNIFDIYKLKLVANCVYWSNSRENINILRTSQKRKGTKRKF